MMRTLKRIGIKTGLALALCLCVCLSMHMGVSAQQTSTINVTLGTTDNGRAGDTVTARIVLGENPGISTFAVKLAYDSNFLTYTGATWANSVEADGNNVQLISEVSENGGPVLNISSILSSTYSNNETMVTLRFTVRQNYTTMPVTLTNREITDSSYAPVTANIVVDATAGRPSDNNNIDDTETESEEETETEEETESERDESQDSNNNNQNNSQNNNASGGNNNTDKENKVDKKSENKLDKTPKTGASDIRFVLGGAIVVFLAVAAICIRVIGRKKP